VDPDVGLNGRSSDCGFLDTSQPKLFGNYRNFHVYSKSLPKATDKEYMPRSLSRNRSQPRRIGERALECAG
jgi:hypothetical protein